VTDQLLSWLSLYGAGALFAILMVASAGVPFPATVLLVAAGSFTNQGEMKLWQVLLSGIAGAIAGDQLGYALARWGGRRLVKRITDHIGGAEMIEKAETFTRKWGGAGIFFSRWLITPLGPWLNVTSGIASYSWPRFVLWDVLGEILWVVLYVMLGYTFSDRVQAIAEILGNLAWVILGLIVVVILGWKIVQYLRSQNSVSTEQTKTLADPAP